jgi:hypothetical protein
MPNPLAPISHHWLDSTHITFGLVTAGVYANRWKAEASVFNGREPDEKRAAFDWLQARAHHLEREVTVRLVRVDVAGTRRAVRQRQCPILRPCFRGARATVFLGRRIALSNASKFADHAVAFGQHVQFALVIFGQPYVHTTATRDGTSIRSQTSGLSPNSSRACAAVRRMHGISWNSP